MGAHSSTLLVLVGVGLLTAIALQAPSQEPARLEPLSAEPIQPELALLMGDLQRLTHKMALSADAGNAELANFYMHESLEQMKKIQSEVPEYEGQPVALLMDRLGLPAYAAMQEAVNAKDKKRMLTALDTVIQSCNACHAATLNPFIRITRGTEVNPFNQSFKP
jgi:hypothetical protein